MDTLPEPIAPKRKKSRDNLMEALTAAVKARGVNGIMMPRTAAERAQNKLLKLRIQASTGSDSGR
jgi:hypothetical protein